MRITAIRRLWACAAAAGITAALLILPPAACASTGPLTWSGSTWCPDRYALDGCTTLQSVPGSDVYWAPANVNISSGDVVFRITSTPATVDGTAFTYASGALNDAGFSSWYPGHTYGFRAKIVCLPGTTKVANWPVMAMNGFNWPAGGEIDFMEGLGGTAAWHFHWLEADGSTGSLGGAVKGNWCGWHTFSAYWGTTKITYYYDGKIVGVVTPADIGQPLPAGPMYALADLRASTKWDFSPALGLTVSGFSS